MRVLVVEAAAVYRCRAVVLSELVRRLAMYRCRAAHHRAAAAAVCLWLLQEMCAFRVETLALLHLAGIWVSAQVHLPLVRVAQSVLEPVRVSHRAAVK